MNFWTSVLAVFIADSILSALKYNMIESLWTLTITSGIYLMVTVILDRWHLYD